MLVILTLPWSPQLTWARRTHDFLNALYYYHPQHLTLPGKTSQSETLSVPFTNLFLRNLKAKLIFCATDISCIDVLCIYATDISCIYATDILCIDVLCICATDILCICATAVIYDSCCSPLSPPHHTGGVIAFSIAVVSALNLNAVQLYLHIC